MRISDWSSDVCSSDLIMLHGLNVREPDRSHLAPPNQRPNMALNSTAIHRQRRYLDRRPLPPEQPAGFGFRQIPVADLSDGQSISLTLPVVRDRKSTRLNSSH